ncbi:MAG: phytoene desaturase family protein [Myxococcota bacterium]
MSDHRYDAIVVGAGIGGLSSAIALAAEGMTVCVVEAADAAGGKMGWASVDGVECDTGPSVLTLPNVFEDVFAAAGIRMADVLTLRRPDPSFRYLFADGAQVEIHHAPVDTLDSVRRSLGADAARELEGFMAYSRGIWEAAAPVFVYGDAPNMATVLSAGTQLFNGLTKVDAMSQMWPAIKKRVSDPHLRKILARYATYNGSDVRCAPATLNCIAHVELGLGGYGVEGGMYQLVRALVAAAKKVGVTFRFGMAVSALRLEKKLFGERVVGVTLEEGTHLAAPRVVANADVAHVVEALLPAHVRHGIPVTETPSMSGYNGILRARRRTGADRRAAHTVLFPHDYEAEFADIFDRDRPPAEPTVYLCAQEVCHGRTGWEHEEPVFVMANAPAEPRRGHRDEEIYTSLRERTLQRMRSAGLCDDDDRLAWERTPKQLAARFRGSRGSIYGAASNNQTAAFQRPSNRVSKVKGLFLASGSAHPGGGVPLAALSGRAAARAALA